MRARNHCFGRDNLKKPLGPIASREAFCHCLGLLPRQHGLLGMYLERGDFYGSLEQIRLVIGLKGPAWAISI